MASAMSIGLTLGFAPAGGGSLSWAHDDSAPSRQSYWAKREGSMSQSGYPPQHMIPVTQPYHWRADPPGYGGPSWTHAGLLEPRTDEAARRNAAAVDARMSEWTFPVEQTTRLPLDRG